VLLRQLFVREPQGARQHDYHRVENLPSFVTAYTLPLLASITRGPMVIVFAGPMLIFKPKLLALQARGLEEYRTLATQYTQSFHHLRLQRDGTECAPFCGDWYLAHAFWALFCGRRSRPAHSR
jgi:hypothetical protein